jgi:transcriptional regulator with XRE-family HTH domain
MNDLGDCIRTARYQNGWSMSELARRAELSRSYIFAIETGAIKNPSFQAIMRIAYELDVNPLGWWITPNGADWQIEQVFIRAKLLSVLTRKLVPGED